MTQPSEYPVVDRLITEDDTPVDHLPSEKQQRLLTEPLYSSWVGPGLDRTFLVAANMGIFTSTNEPPIIPAVFLSLDVQLAEHWWERKHRSYFVWEFGKVPEVVIEIVSNTEGNEDIKKKARYRRMRIPYYVIFDPTRQLRGPVLQMWELQGLQYVTLTDYWLAEVQLGLTLWEGSFEGREEVWLRWCDEHGTVIPTGAERANQAQQRAQRLAERLRALGIDPEAD
ncbi:Uma2 family endonuclease [Candidatus Cyanaurora vandensis]|uniref:Uma2 family endonuclease n=1 Tax=Candidatus Cyanaurora vandensis TaxID=2714958 RepID=UPI00258011B0|nr:Uma2 family endonuclease [Candidatus Cyanaurora vandensis]